MKLHLGQGTTLGPLTLFPVWNESGGRRRYTTKLRDLRISELASPTVPYLVAENDGSRDVLITEGLLLEGGSQDRMALRTLVVPAGCAREFEVACVEVGRWGSRDDQSGRQDTAGRRASEFIRAGWDAGGQAEVWDRISRTHAVASATTSYAEMRLASSMQRAVDRAQGTLPAEPKPLPGQAGVLIGVGGYPLRLEVFDDAATLREQFDAIVEAAWHDTAGAPPVETPGRRARRMIGRLEGAMTQLEVSTFPAVTVSPAHLPLDVARFDHDGRAAHLRVSDRRHPVVAGR